MIVPSNQLKSKAPLQRTNFWLVSYPRVTSKSRKSSILKHSNRAWIDLRIVLPTNLVACRILSWGVALIVLGKKPWLHLRGPHRPHPSSQMSKVIPLIRSQKIPSLMKTCTKTRNKSKLWKNASDARLSNTTRRRKKSINWFSKIKKSFIRIKAWKIIKL